LALLNKWDTSPSRTDTKVAAKKHMKQKHLLSLKKDIEKGSSVLKNLDPWKILIGFILLPIFSVGARANTSVVGLYGSIGS
jgi:hypothetical protein